MQRSRRGVHWWHAVLVASLVLASLVPPQAGAANTPPNRPEIESPQPTQVVADDVHMEMGAPFFDSDGDTHQATDWEIRTGDGVIVVWAAYNSPVLVHAHFSDGVFQGPLAGQRQLGFRGTYLFRVRYQDSGGAWSEWTERLFTTRDQVQNAIRSVSGLLAQPTPRWQADDGSAVTLPAGVSAFLEAGPGIPLLTLIGGDSPQVIAGQELVTPDHLRLRVVAWAGTMVRLPASQLAVVSTEPARMTLYLPAIDLAPGKAVVLWVTETGATFYGSADEEHPTRTRLARDAPRPWQLPPGYQLDPVATSLHLPTSLAFLPNPGADPAAPRFYSTELRGRIVVVTNDGRVSTFADNLLNFTPGSEFPGSGESGLIGICVPPTGHDVYATATYQDAAGGLRNKIIRLRTTDGLTATAVEDVLVVSAASDQARPSHQIQQCSFGPDGTMYVSMADGPDPASAQDDRRFGGKIVRLNPDGTAPRDNPRYDPANPTAPISYQLTKGHRNAFGMAWRPSTNQLYVSENGPNIDRLVQVVPGNNYGWDGTDSSMRVRALYTWPEAHWSPVGLTFIEGPASNAFPPAMHGHLLVATAGPVYGDGPQPTGKAIQEFVLDPDGSITTEPTLFARYIGEGRGSIVDLKARPDGLYFTDLYRENGDRGPIAVGGKVWRIRYVGMASFAAAAAEDGSLTVQFTDTSTLRDAAAWAWDFGDGVRSRERSPRHTFTRPGRYVVSLIVTSAGGSASEHLIPINLPG